MLKKLELRPFQKQALEALKRPKSHVICVAPTGSGKSLIYERIAALPPIRMLLVSPLIALARQQAAKLRGLGLTAWIGTGDPRDKPPPEGRSGTWIVSPEALQSPFAASALAHWKPDFLVVDECHCLWDWGEGFRPAFSLLPELLTRHSIPRSLWLTATLPPSAREDLRARLPRPLSEIGEFALPPRLGLHFIHAPWVERAELLALLLRSPSLRGPGIIFGSTRDSTRRIAALVRALGRAPMTYHAGMGSEERRSAESLISVAQADIVVATSAFGMGMDHPHIRWVVLWQAPPSPLALAQAIGRAGRSADIPATTVALWDEEDFRLQEWTVAGSPRRRADLLATLRIFREGGCRSRSLSHYFNGGDFPGKPCLRCDACGGQLDALTS